MASQGGSSRKSLSLTNASLQEKKKSSEHHHHGLMEPEEAMRELENRLRRLVLHWGLAGERTVKRLRLSKALTVPESTTVQEACRRMAARRVDALLLTD